MRKKILIVEDMKRVRESLEVILRDRNFSVVLAEAEEALAKAIQYKPDLIILDKEMFGLDGLEVYEQLKDNPKTKDIPVILFSGYPYVLCKASGIKLDNWVEKPDIDKLCKRIDKIFS